jgi:ubiquitin-like-conjugating enzyme ATG3
MQNGNPLNPKQVFEDVPADHAFKTVTIETFPHTSFQAAMVHPCKHASVMKKIIERMNAGVVEEQRKTGGSSSKDKEVKKKGFGIRRVSGKEDKKEAEEEETDGMRVDFYLVVFLKFIASIVPTIEVDSTTSM